MPVMSYLAYAAPERVDALEAALARFPECDVLASDRRDVLVVVTDTPSDAANDELHQRLSGLEGLSALVLVSAFTDEV